MGCDIHLHTEIKVNDRWLHYGAPSIPRNYRLFGKMAGVRITLDKPFQVKGLPPDMSEITELDYSIWNVDAHTMSFLDIPEILQLEEWFQKDLKDNWWRMEMENWGYLFGNSFGGLLKYPDDYPDFLQDARFVFWFDN